MAVLVSVSTLAGADGAVPVSPGAEDRFLGTASPCPTFSWSGVEGAEGYELIVYAMPQEEGAAGAVSERPAVEEGPALRAVVPAGALSWTPSSESCLDLGGAYAWSVRAQSATAAGDWSESRLFEVDAASATAGIADAMERALSRYLSERGIDYRPDGKLALLLAEELGGSPAGEPRTPAPPLGPQTRWVYRGGKRVPESDPIPAGVFTDDVELWLEEMGSGPADKVQIVLATPEFDGDPSDAWSIVVDASSTALDPGRMFFSTPSFFDALQLFTDGTAIIGEQREMKLQLRTSPPIACTSFLQEGMFYWDEQANALCVCDGSSWKPVDADETGTCS